MKFKITPSDSLGETLRSEIASLLGGINSRLDEELKVIAEQGEAKAKDWATIRLHSTRQQYESALNAVQIGPNKWAITLNASAAHLEEGYPAFDMKPGMLNSQALVSTGKNVGKKWVRTSKDGSFRYAIVPMDPTAAGHGAGQPSPDSQIQIQNPISRNTSGDLQRDKVNDKMGPASGLQTRQELKDSTNMMIKAAGPGYKKAESGTRIVNQPGSMSQMAYIKPGQSMKQALAAGQGFSLGKSLGGRANQAEPLAIGVVKQTVEEKGKNGKMKTRTAYMTYRVVSDRSPGWKHPGFWGARIFPDLEKWAEQTLPKLIEAALSA